MRPMRRTEMPQRPHPLVMDNNTMRMTPSELLASADTILAYCKQIDSQNKTIIKLLNVLDKRLELIENATPLRSIQRLREANARHLVEKAALREENQKLHKLLNNQL